jgi:hypothetical protein
MALSADRQTGNAIYLFEKECAMKRSSWLFTLVTLAALGTLSTAEEPRGVSDLTFEPPVRLKAGEEFIDTGKHIAHAGPLVVDLDANGKPDLLVGNFAGHFQVYMNVGSRSEPLYEDKDLLKADGETAKVPNW